MDPQDGPVAAFAADLRALRQQAGQMTYRAMAKRTGYATSTLSIAASGASLPSLEVTLAYVQACGGDPQAWQTRWEQTAATHQQQQEADGGNGHDPTVVTALPAKQTPNHAVQQRGSARPTGRRGTRTITVTIAVGLLVVALIAAIDGRLAPSLLPAVAAGAAPTAPVTGTSATGRCTQPTWLRNTPAAVAEKPVPNVQHLPVPRRGSSRERWLSVWCS